MRESRYQTMKADPDEPEQSDGGLVARIGKWSGGIISLALLLGVVYWAYQLGQRDANDVPVIQAMGGVARERPVDPQGTQADFQGLDVNQVLASDETAAIGAETQLAPPPQRANDEDQPISDLPAEPATETVQVAEVDNTDNVDNVDNADNADNSDTNQTAESTVPVVPDTTSNEPVVLNADPDMTRPVRRVETAGLSPNSERLSEAIAEAIALANSTPEEVAPVVSNDGGATTVPLGTRMIQLGVFDDEPSALRNWDFLIANQPDLLSGLERYIERREAGGRVFYRLRALGFADAAAATDMCAVLMGRDVQCIPVAAR